MWNSGHKRRLVHAFGVAALTAVLIAGVPSAAVATQSTGDLITGKPAAARKIAKSQLPDVALKEGILVTDDGTMLWARDPHDPRPMASITKIMTALVALENSSLDDVVTVKSDAAKPGESSVQLKAGDKVPMKVLLEGLLVKSGNDAAVAIAEHVGGTTDTFVEMMNAKARALGLKNTHYANPHGLDAAGHHTTAADLQKLARYAMKNPEFRRIVGSKSTKVLGRTYYTTDKLLLGYRGAMGVKTGFTNGAGYSVVSAAQRDGRTLYAVVLGSPTDSARFGDARTLLDWGFQHLSEQRLVDQGAYLGTVPVTDYLDTSVGVVASREHTATVFDLRGPVTRKISLEKGTRAPVKAGEKLGTVTFVQDGHTVGAADLVASRDVPAPNLFERVGIGATRAWRVVFGPHDKPKAVVLASAKVQPAP